MYSTKKRGQQCVKQKFLPGIRSEEKIKISNLKRRKKPSLVSLNPLYSLFLCLLSIPVSFSTRIPVNRGDDQPRSELLILVDRPDEKLVSILPRALSADLNSHGTRLRIFLPSLGSLAWIIVQNNFINGLLSVNFQKTQNPSDLRSLLCWKINFRNR